MSWKNCRTGILATLGMALTAAAVNASDCCTPCPPAPCGPTYETRKVRCIEYRAEQYETTRTVYRTEWKEEKYTAYRCEVVPETRTRQVVVNKMVPETKNVEQSWYECVPVQQEQTVTRYVTVQKPETVMTTRCVQKGGHYECRTSSCASSCGDCGRRRGLLRRRSCGGCGGCGGCGDGGGCCTQTVNVWVPEYVTEQVPVTVMRCATEARPEKVMVTVYKQELKKRTVAVTTYKCVPETHEEKFTVNVSHTVPVQATRKVAVCVPQTEKVMATRMVPVTVEREITVCVSGCGGCDSGCGGGRRRLLGFLGGCR
jgi:hypothetical protein